MQRTISAILVLAACAAGASGRQPAKLDPPPLAPPLQLKPVEKKADPADAAIAAALANDPDVKMAKAKIQLAEAELAKARQTVTLRVLTLKAAIDRLKAEVAAAQVQADAVARRAQAGAVPESEFLAARDKLGAAKSALAIAETELKLLTGGAGDKATAATLDYSAAVQLAERQRYAATLAEALASYMKTPVGAIPDRIRAALDKPVKLGAKGAKVTLAQALEVFKKDAGLDVPVRQVARVGAIESEGEELPVGAWLQLFADGDPALRFVVREYGLLVTFKDMAPPDALGVVEFWKQKPLAKPETKYDPKPKTSAPAPR